MKCQVKHCARPCMPNKNLCKAHLAKLVTPTSILDLSGKAKQTLEEWQRSRFAQRIAHAVSKRKGGD